MTTEPTEKEPANMVSVVKQIRTASPNTVISGSIGGSGGIQPLSLSDEPTQSAAPAEPQ